MSRLLSPVENVFWLVDKIARQNIVMVARLSGVLPEPGAVLQDTPLFETLVSGMLTAEPLPSSTIIPTQADTPTPAATTAPTMTATDMASSTPEITATFSNPWIVQSVCDENPDCERAEMVNKTSSWFQVTVINNETGESGFFSIRAKATSNIWMVRGPYTYQMTWFCNDEAYGRRLTLPEQGSIRITVSCPSSSSYQIIGD
jgi:hypothetical protein